MSARILVVDDQPNIVDMLATVLRFHGFAVDVAGTADEAAARTAEHRPDLVLLDVMLPDGDGRDVCRRLRPEGCAAGVVLLTARDARDDLIAGLACGGDDWITKPFDVDVMVARPRPALSAGKGHSGTAPPPPGRPARCGRRTAGTHTPSPTPRPPSAPTAAAPSQHRCSDRTATAP